jgi:molybdate transport system ATP-binding protein
MIMAHRHLGLYVSNKTDKKRLISDIMLLRAFRGSYTDPMLKGDDSLAASVFHAAIDINPEVKNNGALFSDITLAKLIEEEYRHDKVLVCTAENATLSSMSSGQQRKALFAWQIAQKPDFWVLDDVFSNFDREMQQRIVGQLTEMAAETLMIQIFYRKRELLPFIDRVLTLGDDNAIVRSESAADFLASDGDFGGVSVSLPEGYNALHPLCDRLIELRNVSVRYGDKQVLTDVNWSIGKAEFWQLAGVNGSGKSTLVTMICGDNPKAYGQDMTLFGRKKGSGESIWDIKRQVGYFTPLMIRRFARNDSVENMIISGLNDTIGLYTEPTDLQRDLARHWVEMLGQEFRNRNFQQLSTGQQRMVMVARAMIKMPPLLILDEPTIELDDDNSRLFVSMVNTIAALKKMAIIYISHRDEPDLKPEKVYQLVPAERGFTGVVVC